MSLRDMNKTSVYQDSVRKKNVEQELSRKENRTNLKFEPNLPLPLTKATYLLMFLHKPSESKHVVFSGCLSSDSELWEGPSSIIRGYGNKNLDQ